MLAPGRHALPEVRRQQPQQLVKTRNSGVVPGAVAAFAFLFRTTAQQGIEFLRDQFAMAALTGILMNDNLLPGNTELIPYRASGCAYEIADAMMEARK